MYDHVGSQEHWTIYDFDISWGPPITHAPYRCSCSSHVDVQYPPVRAVMTKASTATQSQTSHLEGPHYQVWCLACNSAFVWLTLHFLLSTLTNEVSQSWPLQTSVFSHLAGWGAVNRLRSMPEFMVNWQVVCWLWAMSWGVGKQGVKNSWKVANLWVCSCQIWALCMRDDWQT